MLYDCPCIDSVDANRLLILEILLKILVGKRTAILIRKILTYKSSYLNMLRLNFSPLGAVVADVSICCNQDFDRNMKDR